MFAFLKRPGTLIVVFLLTLLGILTLWMFRALNSSAIQAAVEREAKKRNQESPVSAPPTADVNPVESQPMVMDPELRSMSDALGSPEQPPERDLEILGEILTLYRRTTGSNPAGDNADFTSALIGATAEGSFLHRQSAAVREGELVDRWGTPYWFHAVSGDHVEIRSAGPDRELFTSDDLIINPSPEGFGATPALETDQ